MSAAKHVVTTSVIWAAVLAGTLYFFLRPKAEHDARAPMPEGPIAMGPTAPSGRGSMTAPHPMEAPLASMKLTAEQMRSIGVMTGTAELKDLSNDLRATGYVAIDDRLVSYAQVRFSGYLRKVFVDATYQYVKKGEPLFTIYSPDLVATEQEYLLANENQRALSSSSIKGVAAGARSLSTAAERRLEQWEIPASEIEKLKSSGKAATELTIESPAAGYIIERTAYPNMFAEPGTRLYTIADLSRVWVNAQIFQSDVGRLKAGDAAAITVDTYPQKTFIGRVEAVLPQVDAATRTVQVRLLVENAGLLLKPGMFVNVDLKSSLGRRLVVPASAVLDTGLKQVVFVSRDDGVIEPREVVVGPQVGEETVILKGLEPHQSVVTSGNFLLDSESQLQGAAGTKMQPTQAMAPAAGNAMAEAAKIEFTTHPDPPHMGDNQLNVQLSGENGTTFSGADVTVQFFMAAMPQMGMAAMSATAKLTEKSPGVYEGSAALAMGGDWRVTVTAMHGGRVIATKKLSVNAKGGM